MEPAEITARRFAPLLREIVFAEARPDTGTFTDGHRAGSPTTSSEADCKENTSTRASSAGVAAKKRGNTQKGSIGREFVSVLEDGDSEEAKVLQNSTEGDFKRLQLAWDLPNKILGERRSNGNSDGQHGKEDQASPAKRRKSDDQRGTKLAEESKGGQDRFRSELVDAVTELYGWAPAGAPYKPTKEEQASWLGQYRFAPPEAGSIVKNLISLRKSSHTQRLRQIETEVVDQIKSDRARPKSYRESQRSYHERMGQPEKGPPTPPPKPPVQLRKLAFATRAPSTLLKLGETAAAFEPETRLALFLDQVRGGPGAWA